MRRFILIAVPPSEGSQRYPLKDGDQIVGRSSTCDIIIPDKDVSRSHARISVQHGRVMVADLRSRNGTFINGHAVVNSALHLRQQIRFGSSEFRLDLADGQSPAGIDEETQSRRREDGSDSHNPANRLTPAQRRVYDLLLEGKREQEIAVDLGIKATTVHTHVGKIYAVFNVNSRAQLMVRARRAES